MPAQSLTRCTGAGNCARGEWFRRDGTASGLWRLASLTAEHSVAPQITHSAGKRVSVDATDEQLALIETSPARPTPASTNAAA
jgi:hypothetical protein